MATKRDCSFAFVNFWRRYLQRREPLRREASRLYNSRFRRDASRRKSLRSNTCLFVVQYLLHSIGKRYNFFLEMRPLALVFGYSPPPDFSSKSKFKLERKK